MYESQNPHVTIEPEYAPFDDYWKKLAPQAVAGGLPDIIQMDIPESICRPESAGGFEAVHRSGELDVADVSENALSGGEVNVSWLP